MAKVKGKNADFAIDTTVGTVANPPFTYATIVAAGDRIETLSNEVSITIETATIDTSAYGDDFDQFEVLTYRWTVEINAYVTDDTGLNTEEIFIGISTTSGILGLSKYMFCLSPNGKPLATEASATQPRYSGRVLIENVQVQPVRAGVSLLRIRLKGDGQLNRSVAA
jgi:hypothetical protein